MFERAKIINGKAYRYLVRNERIGNRVKQKVVKYLGPVEPVYNKELKRTRRSNAWLFTRQATQSEEERLKRALASSSAFTRDRARIILFSMDRKQCKEIAEKIGCDVRKVRDAIKTFNTVGLKALERVKAKRAEPKFTK